jgi:GT2 family glycosyltransferase
MKYDEPHVSIIMLNWNGWRDTIECLESVYKSDHNNFHVILIDNFSDDDSVEKIKEWAAAANDSQFETKFPQLVLPLVHKPIQVFELTFEDGEPVEQSINRSLPSDIPAGGLILVHNHENSGFSAGNNLGIRIANSLFDNEFIFLLNNDTVIDPKAIVHLVKYLNHNPVIGAATAAIFYYSNPEEIHNVGGKLTPWATCNYFTSMPSNNNRRITFVTGCALMIRKKIFDEIGMLSEKFFFGEEDFEFSWRLRKKRIPVTCVIDSIVYHKVSVSSEKLFKESLKKVFVYALSRVIDMREYFRYPVWLMWKWLVMVYSFHWLKFKYHASLASTFKFVYLINRHSTIHGDVGKDTVEKLYRELEL